MENISTASSSRRSSFELRPKPQPNPKYKRIFENNANYSPSERIKVNNRAITALKQNNYQRMVNSYLFKFCRPQEYNEHFLNAFADFFQHLRGSDPLAMSAGIALADKFRGYQDVCTIDCSFNHNTDYGSASYDYTYSPTPEVIQELKQIIEEEHGLKDFFFGTLQKNHFRISEEFKLENRDTWLREFPIFPRIYPRCADVLKDVFTDLLSAKWLESDINGLKYYLDQNTPIERPLDLGKPEAERVWKLVKQAVEAKINHDEKLNKHFYAELKKDIKNLGISSMVSLGTGNPAFFAGGIGRTVINTLANYSDPEGKQTSVQMMKLLGGSGLGKLMGADVFELGTSMGIDLVEFYVRDEKTTKNEGTALSVYTSALKGLFTGDKQKLIAQILGTCVAETAERVDEKDAPLDIKIILALLKNPDTRGLIVNDIVNEFSKEKPKTGGILTPEEQEMYPKQEPTSEDLQRQAEYEKQLAEYDKWQKDSAAHTLAETNAKNELIQKEAGVTNADKYLQEKLSKYDKAILGRDRLWKKVEKAERNYNNAIKEKNTALNNLLEVQGQPIIVYPKEPKAPKPKTVVGKVWKWTKENVAMSGEMPVKSVPLYQTKAPQSSYSDTQHQIMIESAQLPSTEQPSQPRPNMGQWENVQAMQRDQMFERNMAYQSPVMQNSQPSPLNYQLFWGQGLASNVQIPPSDWSNLVRSETVPYQNPQRNTPIQMAGFVPFQPRIEPSEAMHSLFVNDFTKSMPKGTAKVIAAVCTLMLPDISDVPGAEDPREHFKRAFNHTLKKYDQLVQIQDPNSFGAKAGEFVGEMVALGGVGKVIRVAEGLSVFGMACEGGFIGAIISEAHDTNRVAGIAFGFIGGGAVSGVRLLFRGGGASKPLLDRVLVRPQGFGQQVRAIGAFQQPALRNGFVSEGQVARLTEREIRAITPFKLSPVQSGSELSWISENAPKITQLKQVKGHRFDRCLKSTFKDQNLSEGQVRRLLNYSGFNTYHKPVGLPSNMLVEFSKKNGGMSYRKFGTIPEENLVVRVCPGFAKESIVSSILKGKHLNGELPGTLRQQYPYVVQTRGNLTLTTQGEWVNLSLEENRCKQALAHIPLETYEFKGW